MRKVLMYSVLMVLSLALLGGCKGPAEKYAKTIENLKAAFKGETTASAKYAAFAQKARQDSLPQVAVLFEAASKAESVHAGNHKAVLEKYGAKPDEFTPEFEVKTTKENLQAAIDGETYEFTNMYPDFLAVAEKEGSADAKKSFTWAMETEKKHADFYKQALAAIDANNVASLSAEYYVCPKCGNTYQAANVEEKCSFCMTPKDKFIDFK